MSNCTAYDYDNEWTATGSILCDAKVNEFIKGYTASKQDVSEPKIDLRSKT